MGVACLVPLRKTPSLHALLALLALLLPFSSLSTASQRALHADVIVYDATSGGVIAAVAAARHGASVVLVCASWPACFDEGGRRVGGMSSGGLGQSDIGSCPDAIGGIAGEFYRRNRQHYGDIDGDVDGDVGGDHQQPSSAPIAATATGGLHVADSASCRLPSPHCNHTFNLEPHVALNIFEAMLSEAGVTVLYGAQVEGVSLRRAGTAAVTTTASTSTSTSWRATVPPSPSTNTTAIAAITLTDGRVLSGSAFIDASYEGDLLARAGVSYTTGRESMAQYNESLAGRRTTTSGNNFAVAVDPVVATANTTTMATATATGAVTATSSSSSSSSSTRSPGTAASAAAASAVPYQTARRRPSSSKTPLPLIFDGAFTFPNGTVVLVPEAAPGGADTLVQSYNFRLCVTRNATNALPFVRPAGYDPARWELLRRLAAASPGGWPYHPGMPSSNTAPVPGYQKYDMNNGGAVSSDFVGGSWAYPEASYADRRAIWRAHKAYLQGLLWTLANDPTLPAPRLDGWGLCKDEFPATAGFPPSLYVRAARRLKGPKVFTQNTPHEQQQQLQRQQRRRRRRRRRQAVPDTVDTTGEAGGVAGIGNWSIGVGCYNFDSHNAQRIACPDKSACYGKGPPPPPPTTTTRLSPLSPRTPHDPKNKQNELNQQNTTHKNEEEDEDEEDEESGPAYAWNEGDVEVSPGRYQIPLWVTLPAQEEAGNLLVVAAPSASHIGMSTLRMEPQFMIIGHSAGVAAAIYVKNKGYNTTDRSAAAGVRRPQAGGAGGAGAAGGIGDIDLDALHAALVADGQILTTTSGE